MDLAPGFGLVACSRTFGQDLLDFNLFELKKEKQILKSHL